MLIVHTLEQRIIIIIFSPQDRKDLAEMLKSHRGKFALSSKAKKELRKLYRSNNHYVLNFEDTYRLPDKRHLELLYTCVANLAKEMAKTREIPEHLRHYTEADDRNRVIYHNHSEETSVKIETVLKDAGALKELCGAGYDDSSSYQFLLRVLKEQAVQKEDGTYRLRTKEDGGMDASILQNLADPDATYREKAGKQHRWYVANVIEASGKNGSIIEDYQYEQNLHSDSQFLKETLDGMEKQAETVTIVTDGAYSGTQNEEMAAEKNVRLVTTNLTGREAEDILADFEFSEDGRKVLKCPGGHEPKSCSYNQETGQCTISFQRSQCQDCPHKEQCHPKMFKRVSRKTISSKSNQRAKQQRERSLKSKAVFGMVWKQYHPFFAENTELIKCRYAD